MKICIQDILVRKEKSLMQFNDLHILLFFNNCQPIVSKLPARGFLFECIVNHLGFHIKEEFMHHKDFADFLAY